MREATEQTPAVERAEDLVGRLEEQARTLASRVVARGTELAEDVWAEARAVREREETGRS